MFCLLKARIVSPHVLSLDRQIAAGIQLVQEVEGLMPRKCELNRMLVPETEEGYAFNRRSAASRRASALPDRAAKKQRVEDDGIFRLRASP